MHGLKQIVRFNSPFYIAAASAAIAIPALVSSIALPRWIRVAAYAGTALVTMWIVASLVVSWIVYDWSQLMEWDWVLQALGFSPKSWINLHAGYDPTHSALRKVFPGADGRVFDIFDPNEMTEPSIVKARRFDRAPDEHADFRRLPLETGTVDVATLLLSAHELRTEDARSALFTELRRVLGPAGRVVVAEHLRDWATSLPSDPARCTSTRGVRGRCASRATASTFTASSPSHHSFGFLSSGG